MARPARPAPIRSDGLPARRLAFDVLLDVAQEGAYAALALDRRLAAARLSPADRRLAAALVYDTLDHQLRLDWALQGFLQRGEETPLKLRLLLRLGACQLLFYDRIPPSAAVNTAVSLCRAVGMEGLAGTCNAVLRALDRGRDAIAYPSEGEDPAAYLSVWYSLPLFLVQRLIDAYGYATAKAVAAYRCREAGVTLRPNTLRLDAPAFERLLGQKGWQWEKGAVPGAYVVHGVEDVARDADFRAGRFSIQGQSSMLAVQALAVRPGMQVLDACAAPGGKSCYLAERMNGSGRVQSWDIHPHRVRLIQAQVQRLGLENVRPMIRDAARPREELAQTMDAVLLDAPCSGTGVMAGKPDVKYRLTEAGLGEMTALQRRLLESCSAYVKPGGQLVYSTCSILPEENARQVRAFLDAHPAFVLEPLPGEIPQALRERAGAEGLQLLPGRDGVEGFFIARMRRLP